MIDNIRYPNINGATTEEQLQQIKNYLFQLTEQLNVVLPSIDADIRSVSSTEASSDNIEQDSDVLYSGDEVVGENFTCEYKVYRDGTFDVYVSGTHHVDKDEWLSSGSVYYQYIDFVLPSVFDNTIKFDSIIDYHFSTKSGWGASNMQIPFSVSSESEKTAVRLTIFRGNNTVQNVVFYCHIKGKYS